MNRLAALQQEFDEFKQHHVDCERQLRHLKNERKTARSAETKSKNALQVLQGEYKELEAEADSTENQGYGKEGMVLPSPTLPCPFAVQATNWSARFV